MDLQAVAHAVQGVPWDRWAEIGVGGGGLVGVFTAIVRNGKSAAHRATESAKQMTRIETKFEDHAKSDTETFAQHHDAIEEIRRTAGLALVEQVASDHRLTATVTEIVGSTELRLTDRIERIEQMLMKPRRK